MYTDMKVHSYRALVPMGMLAGIIVVEDGGVVKMLREELLVERVVVEAVDCYILGVNY